MFVNIPRQVRILDWMQKLLTGSERESVSTTFRWMFQLRNVPSDCRIPGTTARPQKGLLAKC